MLTLLVVKLLLHHVLFTGVQGGKQVIYVYGNVEDEAALPCGSNNNMGDTNNNCTWYFCENSCQRYRLLVIGGNLQTQHENDTRLAVEPNCALRIRGLRVVDAGMYFCSQHLPQGDVPGVGDSENIYLSLLAITSTSGVKDLRPGGQLVLICLLHSFHDPWNCNSYNTNQTFSLSWVLGNGSALPQHPSYTTLISPCNATLVMTLPEEVAGHSLDWRCQLTSRLENKVKSFLDLSATFLIRKSRQTTQVEVVAHPCEWGPEAVLAIGRLLVYAVVLPAMVIPVAFFACRRNRESDMAAVDAAT